MSDATEAAIAATHAFIDAFNAQDHQRLADTLNYPHIRLANGVFRTIASREEFIEGSRSNRARLDAEGWDHTVVASIVVVQEGERKVRLAITHHRCRADDTVYNPFDTFRIVTHQDGHWGVQFRSSYLR